MIKKLSLVHLLETLKEYFLQETILEETATEIDNGEAILKLLTTSVPSEKVEAPVEPIEEEKVIIEPVKVKKVVAPKLVEEVKSEKSEEPKDLQLESEASEDFVISEVTPEKVRPASPQKKGKFKPVKRDKMYPRQFFEKYLQEVGMVKLPLDKKNISKKSEEIATFIEANILEDLDFGAEAII